jgi:hypothetical protein
MCNIKILYSTNSYNICMYIFDFFMLYENLYLSKNWRILQMFLDKGHIFFITTPTYLLSISFYFFFYYPVLPLALFFVSLDKVIGFFPLK